MDQRVQATLALLSDSFPRKPSVEELARAVNLSPSYLRRLFRAETGIPLNQYLKSIRIQKAKELIENTFLNMKQVMYAVGIKDKSQFARDFKKLFGLTPTQYKARCRFEHSFKRDNSSAK